MSEKSEKSRNVYFDVINSVKGGSGKTTFAFALAHTLSCAKKQTKVFVIDLDLRGSSWIINYKRYIGRENGGPFIAPDIKRPDYPFVDRLIAKYDYLRAAEPWGYIRTEKEGKESRFYLCAADDQFSEQIEDIEVDIFEQMIYKLILNGMEETNAEDEEIHFILDMPPSYERHAERILKHLLISESSILYKNKDFNKGEEANHKQYYVNLFMMAAASQDHIKQNYNYITDWMKHRTFASAMIHMLEKKRLFIRPVINDVTEVTIANIEGELIKQGNTQMKGIREKISGRADRDDWKEQILDYRMVEHFPPDIIALSDGSFSTAEVPCTSGGLTGWEKAINRVLA